MDKLIIIFDGIHGKARFAGMTAKALRWMSGETLCSMSKALRWMSAKTLRWDARHARGPIV
jgi:hypothetical protein